jgi:hypothetical protein
LVKEGRTKGLIDLLVVFHKANRQEAKAQKGDGLIANAEKLLSYL